MKRTAILLLLCLVTAASAQRNKKAVMAPVYAPGYFINNKGDTVKGRVQVNPGSATDFYLQFAFVPGRGKPRMFQAGEAKAYGFNSRHFVTVSDDGKKLFAERLTSGRLRVYEFRFEGKVKGVAAIRSAYFVRDAYAEGENAGLQQAKKLSERHYKKMLKPYLSDQPALWSELDKYAFDRNKLISTINEFNRFYRRSAAE